MTGIRRIAGIVLLFSVVLLGGCDALDRKATAQYEEAMKAWNAGNHRAAVAMFTALAKNHPYSPHADNALYWVGETQFLYLGETDKALITLNLVLKKYSRRDMAPAAQFTIAQIYELGYNDYQRAVSEYRKAAGYSDRGVREKSLYSLGDVLFRTGKTGEAKESWTRQIREFPSGPQAKLAYYRLGTTAFTKGDLAEAEKYYRMTLEVDLDQELTVKVKYALANCLEAGDSLREALKLYKELEPVYPNREALEIKIRALETRIQKKSY
jgi:TolA-binding protein